MRFHVVMLKTMRDLLSLKRNIPFLIICLIAPVFVASFAENAAVLNFATMSLAMQTQMANSIFLLLSFIWMAGIPLVLLAAVTCGSFITKEEEDGTLLLLVSKPVRRHEIIIGKLLAFFITTVLLEAIALLASVIVMSNLFGLDPYALTSMLNLLPAVFSYSIFVMFVFGCISTGLSVFSGSRVKSVLLLVALAILIFFGFTIIRGWTISYNNIYENYGFNYLDVNYHLGSTYFLFLDTANVRIIPPFQWVLGQFTGKYETADPTMVYDTDLGAMPPSLEAKKYTHPLVSLGIWLLIGMGILAVAVLRFERKEIS